MTAFAETKVLLNPDCTLHISWFFFKSHVSEICVKWIQCWCIRFEELIVVMNILLFRKCEQITNQVIRNSITYFSLASCTTDQAKPVEEAGERIQISKALQMKSAIKSCTYHATLHIIGKMIWQQQICPLSDLLYSQLIVQHFITSFV